MDACPSTFALDDAELHGGPGAAVVARHLDSCDRCQARRARRTALGRHFDAALREPLWHRIDAARRHRPWWRRLGLAGPVLAVAAAVVVVATGHRDTHQGRYRGTKGDLAIEVAGRRAGAVFAVDSSTEVRPGDELQLTVRAARAAGGGFVLAGSVDGTGKFSSFYPASLDGHSMPLPPPGTPLEPPVVLDDAPGPERIVVVLSERPIEARVLAPLVETSPSNLAAVLGGGQVTVRWIVLAKQGRGHPAP
jgi:hypothetical protein